MDYWILVSKIRPAGQASHSIASTQLAHVNNIFWIGATPQLIIHQRNVGVIVRSPADALHILVYIIFPASPEFVHRPVLLSYHTCALPVNLTDPAT
jgi:hypothetical protein